MAHDGRNLQWSHASPWPCRQDWDCWFLSLGQPKIWWVLRRDGIDPKIWGRRSTLVRSLMIEYKWSIAFMYFFSSYIAYWTANFLSFGCESHATWGHFLETGRCGKILEKGITRSQGLFHGSLLNHLLWAEVWDYDMWPSWCTGCLTDAKSSIVKSADKLHQVFEVKRGFCFR